MFALIVSLALSGAVPAQEKALTPELIVSLRQVADAQLSPDGATVVYQITRSRSEKEAPGAEINELWMTPVEGGEPRQFTTNEKGDRLARWSPDGKWLAFLSQRGGSLLYQVYVIPVTGGEARQLTNAEESVRALNWSPDGARIAFTTTDPKTAEEKQAEKEGKDWTIVDRNYKHIRLYTIDVKTKETTLVSRSPLTIHDFGWSPDGKQFVVAAAETPLVDDSYMRVKLMTVASAGGEARLLVPTEGKLTRPRWSPDGKWIAWLGATAMKDPFAGTVFAVPAVGGTPESVSKTLEGTANWLDWQPGKPSTIVFGMIQRQANSLYSVAMSDRKPAPLGTQPVIYTGGPSFSRDGRLMAVVASSPRHPGEVYAGEAAKNSLARLTNSNPQLADVALGEQEIVKWKSVDGWEIEGILVKPVGFRRGTRYPTVLQPHGGPESADLNGWYGTYSRWGQMLAAKGFATLYPNYRGSIGRGPGFAMGDHRDLMGKEFQDMLAGLDHLIREGITDPDRIGIGGGSYGGYTSAWAATYGSDRFRAAIPWMGITNWHSMTGTSDIPTENAIVHWDATMYDNFELYWERSPIAHVKKARTPTLIIHGAADPRVPIGQSHELYTALKWKGVPVEFVIYPREGHGVAERAHQLDFMSRVSGWFEKYLKNENGR